MYSTKKALKCRACGSKDIKTILDLCDMPPGDKYAQSKNNVPTSLISSNIDICQRCNHIQMSGSADPEYIYGNYLSRPASTNSMLKEMYLEYCRELSSLSNGGSVLEVGSNDGLFLELFKQIGVKAIGIEPAKNLIEYAKERGVETINGYVSEDTINSAIDKIGKPSIVLANHCFSNVENIQDWAKSIANGLKDNGFLVLQTFYQKSVLDDFLLENYNHEHLSYVFIEPISKFFKEYGLMLRKCKFIEAKGGSIRLYFQKSSQKLPFNSETIKLIEAEKAFFSNLEEHFERTKQYIEKTKSKIQELISNRNSEKICAYGTSIGATVFTYQFGLTQDIGAFFDDDSLRQGRYSPGIGAPVLAGRSRELEHYSDCLMFAPLYYKQIIKANLDYLKKSGRFILIRPEVESITSEHLDMYSN
tara:strand:+ start:616 stop:1869 length:1254 start_codon:yes stop_codon:yes gene_type:complete